jgi:hypothetical protein
MVFKSGFSPATQAILGPPIGQHFRVHHSAVGVEIFASFGLTLQSLSIDVVGFMLCRRLTTPNASDHAQSASAAVRLLGLVCGSGLLMHYLS